MNPAKTTNRREGFQPNPKLRLREQVREVMRFKHFSLRTEEAYCDWHIHPPSSPCPPAQSSGQSRSLSLLPFQTILSFCQKIPPHHFDISQPVLYYLRWRFTW